MKYIVTLLLIVPIGLLAQNQSIPLPIWEAPIPATQGHFTVSLNSICSIAVEHYDLQYEKKTYPVTECSIETVGGKTARFYFVKDDKENTESDSPYKPAMEVAEIFLPESDDEEKADNKYRVVKVYPQSSTSSSVEYRLKSKSEVIDLYRDLREAWLKWAP